MTRPTFPASVETTPEDDSIYLGFSRQDLDFHQAISELIDNSISAQYEDEGFTVEIHIEKDGEDIHVKVADDGIGIPLDDIRNKVMRIGGRGSCLGGLNEHGFGLKNSLCVLTGNQRDFKLITRDEETLANDIVYVVNGPFSTSMVVDIGDISEFEENITKLRRQTGARVLATTTMQYFRSWYPSAARRFSTIVERLPEHLGVLYRGFLLDRRNEIWLRWRDLGTGERTWTEAKIDPIKIPYVEFTTTKFTIKHEGKEYKATYERGELNKAVVDDGSKGDVYPLRIYYRQSQSTQGIDICVRGRVILTSQMEYIWPEKDRHNSHNKFVGELILDDPEFSTVNNKTKLDPNNPIWEKLLEILQLSDYMPIKYEGITLTEKEMTRKLMERLEAIVPKSTARDDFKTWPGIGVKIDVQHRMSDGKENIYELKAGDASPLDVYQLVMYWDGRVRDGERPTLGRLVAYDAPSWINDLIEYWNARKDAQGKNYNLEFKKIGDILGE